MYMDSKVVTSLAKRVHDPMMMSVVWKADLEIICSSVRLLRERMFSFPSIAGCLIIIRCIKHGRQMSFTDGDITLHFILFDILFDPSIEMSFSEITDQIDERLSRFSELRMFAESTVRKRL